jgi:hypothetical protein
VRWPLQRVNRAWQYLREDNHMLPSTLDILKSVLRSDPSLTPAERADILARLRERPEAPKVEPDSGGELRIVRRAEAARRLSCSLRTVDSLAAGGALPRRKLPGRVRASGFLASDVDALIVAGVPGAGG